MKHNSGGSGSGVYRDPSNGTWAFRVVRDKNYRRSGFRTKALATEARVEFIKNLSQQACSADSLTLDDAFAAYLNDGMLSNASGTVRKKRSVYTHHIGPVFGNRRLTTLTAGEISLYLEKCYVKGDQYNHYARGYAYGYVEGFLKVFYAIFGYCYRKGFIGREQYQECLVDEASRIRMPVMSDEDVLKKRGGVRVYNRKEIEVIRTRLGSGAARLAFEIALNCGLRISEVFALTWNDIDLTQGVLSVNKQQLKIEQEWCLCQPKYIASYRQVFINDYLLQLLKSEYDRQQKLFKGKTPIRVTDRRKTGRVQQTVIGDFVFIKENGGHYSSDAFRYWSRVIRKELHIEDFTFHSLRHTFCSELAALGCPVSELCRMAGHSSINTTMRYYINSTETAEQAARASLNRMAEAKNCPL
ncbi:MAG: site-specific integrase [Firmicutes bacterium]|nr:site-specific integrase [Bacillota bacterium]